MIPRRLLVLATATAAALPAVAPEERFFDSAGVRIRYIEEGRGEPVVLVHGYTTNTEEQFIRPGVFAGLAASYRVIGMDARGHGRSGKPHDPAQYGPEMGLGWGLICSTR